MPSARLEPRGRSAERTRPPRRRWRATRRGEKMALRIMVSAPRHPFRVVSPDAAGGAAAPMDLVLERTAFGGGTHPTTASCLEILAELAPLGGLRVLDLGSGTGILAIAAVRLGAASALCVDVNPDAVASARRNAVLNRVEARLEHRCGDVEDLAGEPFDLVVANVGGELLLDDAARIVPRVRRGGRLLLSGVLRGYADELASAYARLGCQVLARRLPAEFCTLLLRRGAAASRAPGP